MSEKEYDFEILDIDPFEAMSKGDQYRGNQILKLGNTQTITCKIVDIITTKLDPQDIDEKNRKWAVDELAKMKEKGWDKDYIENVTLVLEALTNAVDKQGNPIIAKDSEGKLLPKAARTYTLTRQSKNSFWGQFRLTFKDTPAAKGKKIRLMKLQGEMGQTIIVPPES